MAARDGIETTSSQPERTGQPRKWRVQLVYPKSLQPWFPVAGC